jgi:regulator of replication initiation timing
MTKPDSQSAPDPDPQQNKTKDYSSLFQNIFAKELAVIDYKGSANPNAVYPTQPTCSSTSSSVATPFPLSSFTHLLPKASNPPDPNFEEYLNLDFEDMIPTPDTVSLLPSRDVETSLDVPSSHIMEDSSSSQRPMLSRSFWARPSVHTQAPVVQSIPFAPILPKSHPSNSGTTRHQAPQDSQDEITPSTNQQEPDEKRMKNIISSRKFRQRRREYLSSLEAEVVALRKQVRELSETLLSSQKEGRTLKNESQLLRRENSSVRSSINDLKRRWSEVAPPAGRHFNQKKPRQQCFLRSQSDINPNPVKSFLSAPEVRDLLWRSRSDFTNIAQSTLNQSQIAVYSMHSENSLDNARDVFQKLYDEHDPKSPCIKSRDTKTKPVDQKPLMWGLKDIVVELLSFLPGAA